MVAEFEGRSVLVTGGALGIGAGIVRAFVREGAMVSIADIDRVPAERLAAELASAGGRAIATIGDVSSSADAERMVAETVAAFGRLDVLVNNAGIQPIDWYFDVEHTPEEAWDRILGVNLKGQYLMSKYALSHIRAQGPGGSVINMASVQGMQSMPGVPAYAASKGGILSLTRNMALDYAPQGIRVNAICPGTIDSELVRGQARAEGGDLDANLARYGALHPVGRIGTPEDIAQAALYLASPRASFVTGAALVVDGGFMAQGAWATSPSGSPSTGTS
jgi:NAD(P)-dependent dehydrogenase (short-subunit alcohol dehydrogenase family)